MRLRIALLLLIALSPLVTTRASGTLAVGQVPQPQAAEKAISPGLPLTLPTNETADEFGPGKPAGPTAALPGAPPVEREANPAGTASLEPTPGWQAIMTEDFEGAFPSGLWQVYDADGDTNGEVYWDDDDFKPHSGNRSAWCARGGANGVDPAVAPYQNNMRSVMYFGPFSLSDTTQARLRFYYWNKSEPNYDWFSWWVRASGTPWIKAGTVSGDSGGWQYVSLDLDSVPGLGKVTGNPSVEIAFDFTSDSSVGGGGAYVDDIVLEKALPNLVPYALPGWSYPIMPSSVKNTFSVGPLYVDQPTYIDWAAENIGPSGFTTLATERLYFDGIEIDQMGWYSIDSPSWMNRFDVTLNLTPTAGPHTLKMVVDVNNDIAESNENDNTWEMTFNWLPALPGVFNKSSPGNGATGQPANPTLSWGSSSGATSYEGCINTSASCGWTWGSLGSSTSYPQNPPLYPGITYYWQIRARNERGTTEADGGTWWSFTTSTESTEGWKVYLPVILRAYSGGW